MKRLAGLAEAETRAARHDDVDVCALCGRLLGAVVEWHHPVPKSRGGATTVPVHPFCHRTIHAFVSNRDLGTAFATMDLLREREDIRRYLRWIADKPPDFRAPTGRRRT